MAKKIEQLDLFSTMYEPYKITKPIRLIELFGGIGSQAKALERLNADFERYKLVEWAVPSIKVYASIHEGWRNERATGYSLEQLVALTNGISSDYNKPLTEEQRKKMGQDKLAEIVGAMQACHDMHPDISKIKGEDLEIEREREPALLHYDLLFPLPGFKSGWQTCWNEKRHFNEKWLIVGGREIA